MSTIQPHGSTRARLDAALAEFSTDAWRDGKQLVVRPGCTLPDRCIKCNEPAQRLTRRSFYWHHPGLYVVALLNLLIYAVIAIFVRKRTPVTVGLCRQHQTRRSIVLALATVGALAGTAVAFKGLIDMSYVVVGIGAFVTLASLVFGIVAGRVLVVTRIGENYTRFDGAGAEFLASLPTFYRTR